MRVLRFDPHTSRAPVLLVVALALLSLISYVGTLQAQPVWGVCSDEVHDSYRALGPDGAWYPTWHPYKDEAHTCFHDHEHGDEPVQGYVPLFGYTAAQHGMTEGHEGFKVYSPVGNHGTGWSVVQHMGTAGYGRICTRMHTFDIGVVSYGASGSAQLLERGNVVADTHGMADFGQATVWAGNGGRPIPDSTCAGNSTIPDEGVRRFLTTSNGGIGYEAWRPAEDSLAHIGVTFQSVHIASDLPMTQCNGDACETLVAKGNNKGGSRWLNGIISIDNPTDSDHFTDSHGIPQFIQTEKVWSTTGWKCKSLGTGQSYCHPDTQMVNLTKWGIEPDFITAPN